jgi:iron complex outermembrane receptor protein
VIDAQASRNVGLIDPSAILQGATAAAGQQINSGFSGFVLDNGPGSETISLRGLGAERTLVLVNGRRLAPAGVEGAPGQASINTVPALLVEQYDLLLDGASAVYGSDAIAGVANVILRKDFEGLELSAVGDYATQGAGNDWAVSGAWGKTTDRGFFGIGGEYSERQGVRVGDRRSTDSCETNYEITTDGEIRTVDIVDQANFGRDFGIEARANPCLPDRLVGRIIPAGGSFGSIYYTPEQGNSGVPNFSETIQFGVPVDADGDGVQDVDIFDYSFNGRDFSAFQIAPQERISLVSYGEYVFEGESNITPYYEALYSNTKVQGNNGEAAQLFPFVSAQNPFNPCNPNQPNGVDCGVAFDSLLNDPEFIDTFVMEYGRTPNQFLAAGTDIFDGPLGALRVRPVVRVRGDRNIVDTELETFRGVAGVKGDLPFLNFGTLDSWSFDLSGVYSTSKGDSVRPGIRADRLDLALGNLSDDGTPCDNDGDPLDASVTQGCVPVNLFAPSLYENRIGEFATQAERDYVFDDRTFDTDYTQIVINAFLTGTIFTLPAGEVGIALGGEYRHDDIDSVGNDVATDGLLFGFFSDGGAIGNKDTWEAFGEVDLPLLADKPLVTELTLNLSGRITDDEFYGTNETYSIKGGWRPVAPLLFKASYGTAFRAPNLRENFLAGTTGFTTPTDPCAVPDEAVNDLTGGYDSSQDFRDPIILENCRLAGLDPTTLGGGGSRAYSVETATGGSFDLEPEESTAFTAGVAFEQPWFDSFDLNINVNYYDIEVDNTIVSPTAQFILNDCYANQENLRSVFCSRVTRDFEPESGDPDDVGLVSFLDAGFINQQQETASGIDFIVDYGQEITAFDRPFDLGFNVAATKLNERTTLFVGDDGNPQFEEFRGDFFFPEWEGIATASVGFSDYTVIWQTSYTGAVAQDEEFDDEFGNVFEEGGPLSETCLGPAAGDVNCRDVAFADELVLHTISLAYEGDTVQASIGINNIFDTAPPLVDGSETVLQRNNVALGGPLYFRALDGRQIFVNFTKQF